MPLLFYDVNQNRKNTVDVRITKRDAFVSPLLQWKSNIKHSEFVSVDLVIQHKKRMRHGVICGLPHIFLNYLTNDKVFYTKLSSVKRMFWFPQLSSETFHILRRLKLDAAINVHTRISSRNSVPLQDRSSPEGSRKLRFPDFVTTQDRGKVSLTHRPLLPPGNTPGTHFC